MEKDLKNDEAIAKLKKLAEDVRVCMYATAGNEMEARPMTTVQVDDDGSIWFFTKDDKKVSGNANSNEVYLYYAHPTDSTYLTVHGTAEMVKDRNKMEELWTPVLKAWFPDGIDDPEMVLLKVTPTEARYWDVDAAKLVVLYSMIKTAITGKVNKDMGEHGDLKI